MVRAAGGAAARPPRGLADKHKYCQSTSAENAYHRPSQAGPRGLLAIADDVLVQVRLAPNSRGSIDPIASSPLASWANLVCRQSASPPRCRAKLPFHPAQSRRAFVVSAPRTHLLKPLALEVAQHFLLSRIAVLSELMPTCY